MSCLPQAVLLLLVALCSSGVVDAERKFNFLGSSRSRTTSSLNSTNGIPHIIHQSWSSTELPERYKAWQRTWIDLNPNWSYKLWTDADNLDMVTKHFPWLRQVGESYQSMAITAPCALCESHVLCVSSFCDRLLHAVIIVKICNIRQ